MYKKPLFLALLFVLAASLILLVPLFHFEKKDLRELQKLQTQAPRDKKGLSYSESIREGVVKEIWFREKEAHHMRIISKESALFFFHEGKMIEVVEQMGDVECLMQEKLFTVEEKPMQEVRYLKAKKACYNYNTGLFVAEDVFLSKLHLPGHTLPQKLEETTPLMQGTAESVEFTLKDEKIDFRAYHFKATFDPKKGIA